MKAIVNEIYGSPDVLELREVEKPTPKEDEVLVKVYAASLNPAEWHAMRAEIFLVRLEAGLRKPKNRCFRLTSRGGSKRSEKMFSSLNLVMMFLGEAKLGVLASM